MRYNEKCKVTKKEINMKQLHFQEKTISKELNKVKKYLQAIKKEYIQNYDADLLLNNDLNFYDYVCYTVNKDKCFVFTPYNKEKELINNFIEKYKNDNKIKVLYGHAEYTPELKKIFIILKSKKNLKKEFENTKYFQQLQEL